jgi:hypothetical protein
MNIITNYNLLSTASGSMSFLNDSIVACLYTSGAAFTTDSEDYTTTNELATAFGYTRLNKAITAKTITLDDVLNQAVYDCGDLTWTCSGGSLSAQYCALVDTQDARNKYLYIIDFGETKSADDLTDLKIIISSSGLYRTSQSS